MEIISSLYINPGLKKKTNFLSYHTTWKQYLQFWFIYLTLTMGKTKNSIWQPITILWTLSKQNQIQTINKLLCDCLVNGAGRMSFSTLVWDFSYNLDKGFFLQSFIWHHKKKLMYENGGLYVWPRDKINKMACAPSEDSDQPGHTPSLIRVFAVRMKKAWVLSYPLSAQWRLWSDWAKDAGHTCHFVGFVMRWLIFSCFIRFAFVCSEIKD